MNTKISKLISCIALPAFLLGDGCATQRECFSSFEQRILSSAPKSKEEKKALRENVGKLSYSSLNDTEKIIYDKMLEMKGKIKRDDFTNFEWEALKRFYDIKSAKEITPEQYIFLQRVVERCFYRFGTK